MSRNAKNQNSLKPLKAIKVEAYVWKILFDVDMLLLVQKEPFLKALIKVCNKIGEIFFDFFVSHGQI